MKVEIKMIVDIDSHSATESEIQEYLEFHICNTGGLANENPYFDDAEPEIIEWEMTIL